MGIASSLFESSNGDDEHDHMVLDTYNNWVDCLLYDKEASDESIFRILNSIGIIDEMLIQKHILNIETKIRTPSDFVASKVINMLTAREQLIYLKPWGYYKVRESNVNDTFVLSEFDDVENIASDNNHVFWTILCIINNVCVDSVMIEFAHVDFWVKLCILLGNLELASLICHNFNKDILIFEKFRFSYSPIDSPLVSNLKDTE